MKFNSIFRAGLFCGLMFGSTMLFADEPPEVTEDGLHRVKDTEVNLVYAKEGVNLGVYNKIWLAEATVAFRKNWQRDQNRAAPFKVNAKDMERMKSELSELFREVFTEKLTEAGNELVSEAGEDVLYVLPAIVNLDVAAPDTRTTSRSYQLTQSAGEMTLYVELYDSVTGDILVKALDRVKDREKSYFQWQTSASNRAAAKKAIGMWADILAAGLAEARSAVTASEDE